MLFQINLTLPDKKKWDIFKQYYSQNGTYFVFLESFFLELQVLLPNPKNNFRKQNMENVDDIISL